MKDLKREIGQQIRRLRQARRGSSGPRRRIRTARKMTIQELAEASNLSVDYVNKLELGKYMPTAETLRALATALEVEVCELFPEPSARQKEKREALDDLRAYAAQFSARDIRHLLRVMQAMMERP